MQSPGTVLRIKTVKNKNHYRFIGNLTDGGSGEPFFKNPIKK